MKKYNIDIAEQAHESLRIIVKHKIEYAGKPSAKKFADGFYDDIKTLSILPHRGFKLSNNYKAKIYNDHLIVYKIIEPKSVRVIDIIDPGQHSVASKYY